MYLTKRLCRRFHAMTHWVVLPTEGKKIPRRKYSVAFMCHECRTKRFIDYPYCAKCETYHVNGLHIVIEPPLSNPRIGG